MKEKIHEIKNQNAATNNTPTYQDFKQPQSTKRKSHKNCHSNTFWSNTF